MGVMRMFKRPRYIHKQVDGQKFRGFSVLLTPAEHPDSVNVSVVFCSRKDQFCKRTARELLSTRASFPVPVANLPKVIYAFQVQCEKDVDTFINKYMKYASNEWTWLWKYFL